MGATPGARTAEGLTEDEARRRLAAIGPNELPAPPPHPWWRHLVAQMVHFFALMLWGAALLALVGGLPALAIAIVAVVLINGVFSFVQEYRAERMATRLARPPAPAGHRASWRRRRRGRRDAARRRRRTDARRGDRVSADAEVVEAHSLLVDLSTLTGESVAVAVEPSGAVAAGTFVVEGEATAIVGATGAGTRLASIASLARARVRPPARWPTRSGDSCRPSRSSPSVSVSRSSACRSSWGRRRRTASCSRSA